MIYSKNLIQSINPWGKEQGNGSFLEIYPLNEDYGEQFIFLRC